MSRLIDADALVDAMTGACNIFDAHGADTTLARALITIADKAPTIGGWISVKDRLPGNNQIVIVSDGQHTWDVGMYKGLCGKPSKWNWKKNTVKTVLWWMPKDGALPEPPKEES